MLATFSLAAFKHAVQRDKRLCLFEDEKSLGYFYRYSQGNCFLECAMRLTIMDQAEPSIPCYLPTKSLEMRMCDAYQTLRHDG